MPYASIADIIAELQGTGGDPYQIYDWPTVSGSRITDFIEEAEDFARGQVGDQLYEVGISPLTARRVKHFEVHYASGHLIASLLGIVITDGYNYSLGNTQVQRYSPKFQTYMELLRFHLNEAHDWLLTLHDLFFAVNETGLNEYGSRLLYWNTFQGWGF